MHVLFLTQILPYPPDAGPRIKTWHVIRYLAERGDRVTLVTFLRPEERQYLPVLEELCDRVYTVPIRRSRAADMGYFLRSLVSGRPFLIERDDLAGMREQVNAILQSDRVDIVHADQLTMTQFALPAGAFSSQDRSWGGQPAAGGPRLIFDAHNATWTILDRLVRTSPVYTRPLLSLERDRLKRYEGHLVRRYDATLAVTEIDREALIEAARSVSPTEDDDQSARLGVIPIAIDTRQEALIDREPDTCEILAIGSLNYPPNAGGIRWFMQEVFPLIRQKIPEVHLTVIGKNPPVDFLRIANEANNHIEITGYVNNLQPYLKRSTLMVVPVLAGGGMRVRILEAFARGLPVVTTTIGLEGINAQPGRDVLVEDTPQTFAAAVGRVLSDPTLQNQLTSNGRDLVERCYDWQAALKQLDDIYQRGKS